MTTAEPSSFRDQSSRLHVVDGRILRAFTEDAGSVFQRAHDSGALAPLVDSGSIVPYRFVDPSAVLDTAPSSLVVESDAVPFVSMPAEWSFSMLRDAALLTLDINLSLLDHGFILKDATAFNVLFRGSSPVFIDLGSIEPFGDEGLWAAYGQFVDHFLSPLLLEAHAGVPFQPRLRGSVDGIPVTEANALLRGRARRKPGVFTHVSLRSRMERTSSSYGSDQRRTVAAANLPREAVKASLAKMRKLVAGLESDLVGTWSDYESAPPYEASELEAKREFVQRCARSSAGGTLVDVGANTGFFTRAIEQDFDNALAIDVDPGAVDRLYQRLAAEGGSTSTTPLVVDLLNPTPAAGWRNQERASFLDRLDADFAIWLAVLHHLTITGGVPLGHSLELASAMSHSAVIEFVMPSDPMVELISAASKDDAAPYDEETFSRELEARFDVIETLEPKPTRRLYHVRSKAIAS